MTTQAVEVNFYTRSGKTLTLFNADVDDSDTDGEEILSGGNGLNVPTGTSLGQYGQGETITHGLALASRHNLLCVHRERRRDYHSRPSNSK